MNNSIKQADLSIKDNKQYSRVEIETQRTQGGDHDDNNQQIEIDTDRDNQLAPEHIQVAIQPNDRQNQQSRGGNFESKHVNQSIKRGDGGNLNRSTKQKDVNKGDKIAKSGKGGQNKNKNTEGIFGPGDRSMKYQSSGVEDVPTPKTKPPPTKIQT